MARNILLYELNERETVDVYVVGRPRWNLARLLGQSDQLTTVFGLAAGAGLPRPCSP